MPDSSRSSVDLPAPLCPTRPTRSPISSDIVMSRSASMTTTLDSLRPMVPPALPRNAFFSERDLASKIGNSTHALRVSMCGCSNGHEAATGTARSRRRVRRAGPDRRHPAATRPGASARAVARRHLLGEQRGLDAVEQAFEPADQLGLRDPQLGVRRHSVLAERQRQPLELVAQFRRQPVLELADAGAVDLAQPAAAGVVERCRAHLFEQLLDHGADPHHLGRLLDEVGHDLPSASSPRVDRPVAADDLDVVVVGVRTHPFRSRLRSSPRHS